MNQRPISAAITTCLAALACVDCSNTGPPATNAPDANESGTITTLALGQSNPQGIAVDATNVYWTNSTTTSNSVVKVPLNGGTPTTLASVQGSSSDSGTSFVASVGSGIAVNATVVVWTIGDAVFDMLLSGGAPTPLVSDNGNEPFAIAVDATNVYWVGDGKVMKAPLGGGAATTLFAAAANTQAPFGGIAVDATSVYWTAILIANNPDGGSGQGASICKVPINGGGAFTTLASGYDGPYNSIAVDATNVYWTTSPDIAPGIAGTVMTASSNGGNSKILAMYQIGAASIAVDATNLYWTTSFDGIMTMPIHGATPTTLASVQANGIAVDATSVYWTVGANAPHNPGTVMKIAK